MPVSCFRFDCGGVSESCACVVAAGQQQAEFANSGSEWARTAAVAVAAAAAQRAVQITLVGMALWCPLKAAADISHRTLVVDC